MAKLAEHFLFLIFLTMGCALGEILEREFSPGKISHAAKSKGDVEITGRIGNGEFAQLRQFPWHARLAMDFYYFCGGAIIAKQWVLTSAFCVYKRELIIVRAGYHNDSSWADATEVWMNNKKFVHPNYNNVTHQNDIALVKLDVPLNLSSRIDTVKLAVSADFNKTYVGQNAVVTGFGQTWEVPHYMQVTSDLKYVELKIISNQICTFEYNSDIITNSKLCTDSSQRKSTCHSDSGGPLVMRDGSGDWELVGVASFTPFETCNTKPSVFTKVAAYRNWIDDVINKETSTTTTTKTSTTRTTTSRTPTVAPPICFSAPLSAMHGCCNSPPSALLTFDSGFKQYPKTFMKYINEYQMNIQQDRKRNNAVNYQNPRKPQEMKKGACFSASFLRFKNLTNASGNNFSSNALVILKKAQSPTNWANNVETAFNKCVNSVSGFNLASSGTCPLFFYVTVQCIQANLVQMCEASQQKTDRKCAANRQAFGDCAAVIYP